MFEPLIINGDVWRLVMVDPQDPVLIDRTGSLRVATTDPDTRTVYLSDKLRGEFLDTVLLHEAAHCAMVSHGLLDSLHRAVPRESWVYVEEWACNFLANHSREVIQAVNSAMPRLVGVRAW